MEKYLIHSNELHFINKERIHQAVEKMVESLDIRENQAEKEKTKEIRQKMEAEKERLLSEQASAEEERIRKKMEKLQNREKNKKTKNKASASTPASIVVKCYILLQR